ATISRRLCLQDEQSSNPPANRTALVHLPRPATHPAQTRILYPATFHLTLAHSSAVSVVEATPANHRLTTWTPDLRVLAGNLHKLAKKPQPPSFLPAWGRAKYLRGNKMRRGVGGIAQPPRRVFISQT